MIVRCLSWKVVLKVVPCAMERCEPGQDRKAAAISICFHVLQDSVTGANCHDVSRRVLSEKGPRLFINAARSVGGAMTIRMAQGHVPPHARRIANH